MTAAAQKNDTNPLAWPKITKDNMPGTRWWWMGSAVNPADLARELKTYREAGLGTVEITPIYGVKGSESQFIEYLSPRWMEMLKATVAEAQKLGMNVDMVTGTGWCFGGPEVNDTDANARAVYDSGAVSQKPSGVKVKRPAPGGEGWMLNLLYPDAMTRYLQRFSDAFSKYDGPKPHAQFHDSYEYESDWAPDFFEQFEKRRGYKLQGELPALFEGKGDPEHVARVMGDYRETVSDLIEESIARWTKWSHERGFLSRNQAHGSPGNWLDIYAASDIPETEIDFFKGGDIGISKFASSAAHVAGKNVVSSETGTWSSEHFTETLASLKSICDDFYLAGVNRIMWHGTTYSPADAPWPGWCFYASTEMNPRNAIWHDAPALHAYLARVQSLMQSGRPHNDVLLYWPIHDLWHDTKENRLVSMSVHGREWFGDQVIGKTAEMLWQRGYAFDYISDKLLQNAKVEGGSIDLAGSKYRALIVPGCEHMPLETMKKLVAMARAGVAVIFADRTPNDVPGLQDLEKCRSEFQVLASKLSATPGDQLDAALGKAGVRREQALTSHEGVQFIRRAVDGGVVYFIANRGTQAFDESIKLASAAPQAAILDPMTGRTGLAEIADGAVRLQLDAGESLLVRTFANQPPAGTAHWQYRQPSGSPIELTGKWDVEFIDGGPSLPKPFSTETLGSWAELGGPEARRFAGTARYTLRFAAPSGPQVQRWTLDLGKVVQSARVRLNGKDLGTVFTPPFRVSLEALKSKDNVLEVEVTGTSANRIRDLDVRGVPWKIFHDANIVNSRYQPFDAAPWPIAAQGLIGPVTLEAQIEQP